MTGPGKLSLTSASLANCTAARAEVHTRLALWGVPTWLRPLPKALIVSPHGMGGHHSASGRLSWLCWVWSGYAQAPFFPSGRGPLRGGLC